MGPVVDAETGFQYLRARYYDPAAGQFLSRDPLVAQTGEPYAYAANNPTNLTDPTGLAPWDDKCIRGVNCPWSTPSVLESWGDDHPEAAQHIVNFAGGVLDVNPITAFLPLDLEGNGVDPCSGWYKAGQGSMFAADLAIGGHAVVTHLPGRGIGFGNFARIARHTAHRPVPTTLGGGAAHQARWLEQHHAFRSHWHVTWRGTRTPGGL